MKEDIIRNNDYNYTLHSTFKKEDNRKDKFLNELHIN